MSQHPKKKKKPIINAHTHIFTGNFVPPYLAKSIVPWPFYFLLNTSFIIKQIKRYLELKSKRKYEDRTGLYASRRRERTKMSNKFILKNTPLLNIPIKIIGLWLTIIATLYFVELITLLLGLAPMDWVKSIEAWMGKYYLYFSISNWFKALWVVAAFILIPSSRRILWQILQALVPILKKIFSKQVIHLASRYWQLGRFSFYESQSRVSLRALSQLPEDSEIVILPMDMEYMDAGKTKVTEKLKLFKEKRLREQNQKLDQNIPVKNPWKESDFDSSYKYQMSEIWHLVKKTDRTEPKDQYHPFLFLDPRRILEENQDTNKENFFDYELVKADENGNICKHGNDCKNCSHNRIILKDCYLKTYMEDRRFAGFKIYPALGYFVFDETLLPIWRYAAENDIPIMTHCVFGTIHYRGAKKKEWNFHPVFKMQYDQDVYEPMMLPKSKPVEFQVTFTHPLNYLCLVEEKFLKILIQKASPESNLKEVFGYNETEDSLQYNLKNLKICLAHFGGAEEWTRYMEQDRNNYSQRLMRDPENAIRFMTAGNKFSWDKLYQLWHKADWYSLICSMIIEYDNIYADLSYIIAKPSIYPLLKYSLEKGENYEEQHAKNLKEINPNHKAKHYTGKNKLRSRILFGTDFYVVRNHKSDKDLLIETKTLLSEEDFDLIARENTHNYLHRTYNYGL